MSPADGGEKFCVALVGLNSVAAEKMAKSIQEAVSNASRDLISAGAKANYHDWDFNKIDRCMYSSQPCPPGRPGIDCSNRRWGTTMLRCGTNLSQIQMGKM